MAPLRTALGALVVAALVAPGPAGAQQPVKPTPGCAGLNFTDARGDAKDPSLDLVSGFLTTSGDDVWANLELANLDGDVNGDSDYETYGVGYEVQAPDSDRSEYHLVSARLWRDGHVEYLGYPAGSAKPAGAVFGGADGIVQLRLPDATPSSLITIWSDTGFDSKSEGTPVGPTTVTIDNTGGTDDSAEGRRQAINCTPGSAPPPDPPPSGGSGGQGSRGVPPLPLTITKVGRAGHRSVRIGVRSSRRLGALRATLVRSGKVVARGRIARLRRSGNLRLKAPKTLRRGVYKLSITGRLDGRAARFDALVAISR